MERAILSAKLSAKALVVKNVISIEEAGRLYEARPLGWNETGLVGMLKRAFTLKYFLYRNERMLCAMRYDDIHDKFIIEKGGRKISIKTDRFTLGNRKYCIKTSMRRVEIIETEGREKKVVGRGKFGLSSYTVSFDSYPDKLKGVIKEISALLIVRKMVWAMINPI
jgi:hypothetical protein